VCDSLIEDNESEGSSQIFTNEGYSFSDTLEGHSIIITPITDDTTHVNISFDGTDYQSDAITTERQIPVVIGSKYQAYIGFKDDEIQYQYRDEENSDTSTSLAFCKSVTITVGTTNYSVKLGTMREKTYDGSMAYYHPAGDLVFKTGNAIVKEDTPIFATISSLDTPEYNWKWDLQYYFVQGVVSQMNIDGILDKSSSASTTDSDDPDTEEYTYWTGVTKSVTADITKYVGDTYTLNGVSFVSEWEDGKDRTSTIRGYIVPKEVEAEIDSGGSDINSTLIGIIPIFVALGLIMGIMGLFYQNRKTI
jgi:hypothetical protein